MIPEPALALVGRVRRAHGIRGELEIEPLTDEPDATFAPGRRVFAGTAAGELWLDPGSGASRPLTVAASRPFKNGLLVTFGGIVDRTEAERWNGRYLLAPFSELSPPEPGEVYLHELEGMRVIDSAGADVGTVSAWYRLPNGILLGLRTAAGEASIPFNERFVRRVDRAARTITVELPEGLLSGGE